MCVRSLTDNLNLSVGEVIKAVLRFIG